MKVETQFVDSVDVGPRHRGISQEKVNALAASMDNIGLQTPISVWVGDDDTCLLVAGRHRLEAARKLGWETIPVFFVAMDEIDRELWEIDENLMRADLSPSEEAQHLSRRKILWEQKQKVLGGSTCATKPQHGKGFAQETAEHTGQSKASVNKAVARAEAIPQHIMDLIYHTQLDTGVYLDALKKLPDAAAMVIKVREDLARIEAGKAKTTVVESDEDRDLKQFEALVRAWNKASPKARELFEDFIS